MKKLILCFLMMLPVHIALNASGKSRIIIPAVFSDNMVLQQKTRVTFWGKASAGMEIKLSGSWGSISESSVNDDGSFKLTLQTPEAGGPFEVSLEIGDSVIVYKNVLIGEVWLCSGQSNMEMPLGGWMPHDSIFTAAQEIPKAFYKNLRFFTVAKAYSVTPEFNCGGSWSICTPPDASAFSAAAFFFGKKLMEKLNVPIGLIHSSWGGTPVESWISGKFLGTVDEYTGLINKMAETEKESAALKAWLETHETMNVKKADERIKYYGLKFGDTACAASDYNDSLWSEMKLPVLWENTGLGNFDGAVWFRKKIDIPDSWLNRELVLELGPIDDMDNTYVNGEKVGSYAMSGYWQQERIYEVPAQLTGKKEMTIAVRVLDTQGGGGIYGLPEKMFVHPKDSDEKILLAGMWKYLPVAELVSGRFYIFGAEGMDFMNRPKVTVPLSANTPTMLYNGMIAPLIPFSIKGVIWYQGESNADNSEKYKILFPLMIQNWRADWNEGDFPFYYVQIAPFNYGESIGSQALREVQMQTLSVKNTGMAVTLDIGNVNNIHPGNKKDVGERLARWALAKDYGKNVVFSGPHYKKMKIQKDKVILTFDYADGLILKQRNGKTNFEIAGSDSVFHDAGVNVKNNSLIISSPDVKNPAAVRYCWGNTAEATLFNDAGLPASSFRTDDWRK